MIGGARGVRALLDRVIGFADKPTDDDDLRLRKRVVLSAGYVLIVGALQLPFSPRWLTECEVAPCYDKRCPSHSSEALIT